VNPTLPSEAVDFGEAAGKAFLALGGVDVARRAEAAPADRLTPITTALDALGVADLDPSDDVETAAAAGELCRQAGRVVLPYPVVASLVRVDGRPLALVPEDAHPVDHADAFPEWVVSGVDASAAIGAPRGERLGTRLGAFVGEVEPLGPAPEPPTIELLLHLTLTGWQILGTLERALELAVEHVNGRIQFGKPISSFQSVQFQLADAAVAVDGLRELSRFTLWRIYSAGDAGLADALALRLAALDSARAVLRTTQQLHGAAGVCDEYDISVLCRHVQPALRLPFGAERTATEMARAVRRFGFEALFPHGGGQ
jgi:hypothetical protein